MPSLSVVCCVVSLENGAVFACQSSDPADSRNKTISAPVQFYCPRSCSLWDVINAIMILQQFPFHEGLTTTRIPQDVQAFKHELFQASENDNTVFQLEQNLKNT